MTLWTLILLALIQGITEFLPISSSGHLILLHDAFGGSENDLALDVAVHLGSILAVILYFSEDAGRAFRGLLPLARGRLADPGARLALALVIATIPAILFGALLVLTGWVDALRSMAVIGWMMIVFGVILWAADRWGPEVSAIDAWGPRQAVLLGLAQAVALIPGVSRSGISITAARALGYRRTEAARISMLMSIPITLATGAVLARDLLTEGAAVPLGPIALAALFAFAAAYGALALMMRFLPRVSFTPYVIYRIALGVLLLGIAYS